MPSCISGIHEKWYGFIYLHLFLWNVRVTAPLCSHSQCFCFTDSYLPISLFSFLLTNFILSIWRDFLTSSIKYLHVSFNNKHLFLCFLSSCGSISFFFAHKLVEFIVFTSSFPIYPSIWFPAPPKSIANILLTPENIFRPPLSLSFQQNLTLSSFFGFPGLSLSWMSSHFCWCFNILCRVFVESHTT